MKTKNPFHENRFNRFDCQTRIYKMTNKKIAAKLQSCKIYIKNNPTYILFLVTFLEF